MTIRMTYAEITERLKRIIGEGRNLDELIQVIDRETTAPFFITPLMMAVLNFDLPSVRLLIQKGVNTEVGDKELESGGGRTALHYAARFGIEPIVEELVRAKANVNAIDNYTATPLWYASRHRHIGTVRFLLSNDADPNVVSKPTVRGSPLIAAIEANHSDIVQLLLEAGADPDMPDSVKVTPLIKAAMHHQRFIVENLLSKGARLDRADRYGYDALMAAALGNHSAPDTIAVLLQAGADISKKNKQGQSAVDKLKMTIEFIERTGNKEAAT
jgi:ankyrin repeat protein